EAGAVLYVSNMGDKVAGDGFISKVSLEGKILDTLWIEGLDDPKGLLVQNRKLYATDNTKVVEVDLESGQINNTFAFENAVMLNDIASDNKGNFFVSDTGKNTIYKMNASGDVSEWLNSEGLESPNGVY